MDRLTAFLKLVLLSITRPREAAQVICSIPWPDAARLSGLVVLCSLVTMAYSIDTPTEKVFQELLENPMIFAALYGAVVLAMCGFTLVTAGIFRAPRQDFAMVFQAWIWLFTIELFIEVATIAALLMFMPEMVVIIVLLSIPYRFYIHSVFLARALEFETIWMGFATLLVASFSFGFLLLFIVQLFNVGPILEIPT